MAYEDIIEYLYGLQKYGIKFGLSNTVALMERLGEPHKRFRSVHITGTNGKGSTAAFIASVLRSAGYKTGLYTSPHLISFTERIRINNLQIPEERVVALAERVREASASIAQDRGEAFTPTFFEVTTAIGYTYFAEEGVDIAVIEVGMGGRLDATNVITPVLSVITNIDLEHTEFLGDTHAKIAFEKAGIIKQGVPVVTAVSHPEAAEVIEKMASEMSAPLFRMGRDFRHLNASAGKLQSFDYQGMRMSLNNIVISMMGRHQIDNACLSLAALECMTKAGFAIPEAAMREGLREARWEGRLELVSNHPDVYLDGAHNPASSRVLASSLRELKKEYNRLILVIGILSDKDYHGILSELVPLADHIIATRPQYSRALDPAVLAAEIKKTHGSVEQAPAVEDAVKAAISGSSEKDLIVVTGSLYVVGEARGLFVSGAKQVSALGRIKG